MVSQSVERHGQTGPTLITNTLMLRKVVGMYLSRPHLPVFFDSETTGLNPRTLLPISLQFKHLGKEVFVVDVRIMPRKLLRDILEPLFDGRILIVGTNLKYDYQVMMQCYGIRMKRVYDCQLAEQVIYGLGLSSGRERGVGFGLKSVAERRLGIEVSKEERKWFYNLNEREEWNLPIPEEELRYAALDVELLEPIYLQQIDELKEKKLTETARIEMKCLPAVAEIELNGVRIDREGWSSFNREKLQESRELENKVLAAFMDPILEKRAKKLDKEREEYRVWEEAKKSELIRLKECWEDGLSKEVSWGKWKVGMMKMWRESYPNPGKPKPDTSVPSLTKRQQLLDAFEVFGIPLTTTKEEDIEKVKWMHPALGLYIEWKHKSKFCSSFGENILNMIDVDGRLHAEINQIGADTGRMSSRNPNSQQFPNEKKPGDDGSRLRSFFIAEEGHKLLTADYSAQELFILADQSGDPQMLDNFERGVDSHCVTARLMFNLPADMSDDEVKKHRLPNGKNARVVAKKIAYGLGYGQGAYGLADELELTTTNDKGEKVLDVKLAQEYIDSFFRVYAGADKHLKEQAKFAVDHMYSLTVSGRKRYFSIPQEPVRNFRSTKEEWLKWKEKNSEYRKEKASVERAGKNTPIQGSAADMTKIALYLFHKEICKVYPTRVCNLVLVVHDEIVAECPTEQAPYWAEKLASCMEGAAAHYLKRVKIPKVQVNISDRWGH